MIATHYTSLTSRRQRTIFRGWAKRDRPRPRTAYLRRGPPSVRARGGPVCRAVRPGL